MTDEEQSQPTSNKQYYILGFIVLIAIVIAGYLLRGNSTTSVTSPTPVVQTVVPSPTLGPISGLGCDTQYYNPIIGYPKYYLSVEGGDVSTAKKVDCTFTVSVDNKVVATDTASSPLTNKPQRGGSTFRCTSGALQLAAKVPTVVAVVLKDDLNASSTCSATFGLPTP